MNEELTILTNYIASWSYQLLAMFFLSFSMLFLVLPYSLQTAVMQVSFFLIFIFCQYKSLKRKSEV